MLENSLVLNIDINSRIKYWFSRGS